MPADRTLAADVAQALVDMYAAAQQEVVENIATRLKAGIDRPGWDHVKLAQLGLLRTAVQGILGKLAADTTGTVQQTLVLAFRRGGDDAVAEIAKLAHLDAKALAEIRRAAINADALNVLAFALRSTLLGTHLRVLRWSLDAYREVVAKAAATGPGLIGTRTRLQVAQKAWSELVEQGITGFVDRAGRRWQLSSYVEMATRTTIAHAVVQAHSDQLDSMGVELRIVSDAPQECVKCRPWEGKILTATGDRRILVRTRSVTTGEPMVVRVAGSVDEAIARGLLHPNCRHTINAYLPGATKIPTNTADPEGDKARQRLRALERDVRAAKVQASSALTDTAAAQAQVTVRAVQAKIRDHLASNPGLIRQPHREQIGAGNIPLSARRPPPRPAPPTTKPTHDQASDHTTVDQLTQLTSEPPEQASHPTPTTPPVDHRTLSAEELEAAFNDAVESGDDTAMDAALAEMDRRQAQKDQAAAEQAEWDQQDADRATFTAENAPPKADDLDPEQAAKWDQFEALLAAGETEETAAAEVFGRSVARQRRDRAIAQLRGQGYTGRGFDELARKAYRDHVSEQYFQAEADTRGQLTNPVGRSAGINPRELFTGPAARARKWASDELKEWWDEHGRMTYDDWVAHLLGDTPTTGGTTGDSWLQ